MPTHPQPTLVSAVARLAAARSFDEVAQAVRGCARAVTGADGVSFVLREGDHCFYAEEDAIAPLWKGRRFPLETCISGWSMVHREAVAIADIREDSRIPQDAYRPTFVRSLFMVPVGQDDPVAAIGAYWARPHEPTQDEREVLHSLAHAAGMALRNVHLDEELRAVASREREARESAEQLSQMKDQFLATLSHELRTPLHVIRNWAYQLKKLAGENEHIRKAAEVIDRNASIQSRLIEDLLDVSRAAAGKLKVERKLIDLGAMCAAVVEVLQPGAREKNLALTLETERAVQIWGDPDRIQQIVWNVVTNAIKFTPAGEIRVKVLRRQRHACVLIEDTGIGVDAQFLPHIFERFRQADTSATRRHGGLGLGLSIVKDLMELHRGAVRAESDGPGKGLKVTLEFPVPVVADQPGDWLQRRANRGIERASLEGLRVLIVDDEEDVLAALDSILTDSGASVIKARGAEEALSLIAEHHPSVILSDLAMPNQDGFTLVRQIRRLPNGDAKIPVAALSALVAADHESEAAVAGFQSYIEKPVTPEELIARVRRLGGERLQ